MTRGSLVLRLLAVGIDAVTLSLSVLAAYWVRFDTGVFSSVPEQALDLYLGLAVMTGVVGAAILDQKDRMRPTAVVFSTEVCIKIVQAVTLTFLVVLVLNFWLRGYVLVREIESVSRLVLGVAWGLAILGMIAWRAAFNLVLRRLRRRGRGLRKVLIVGADRSGRAFYNAIRRKPHLGYAPVGVLEDRAEQSVTDPQVRIIGKVADLQDVIARHRIDEVIVTSHYAASDQIAELIGIGEKAGISISILPGSVELVMAHTWLHDVAGFPIVTMEKGRLTSWGHVAKRGLDLVVLCPFVVVMLPALVLLVIAVGFAIRLDSPGPIIFRQQRMGKGGRAFHMYKFRSMRNDAEALKQDLQEENEADGPLFKIRDDPRVTRVGRWLRRYSIDELPQLINVLRGDMSLVGPRPPLAQEVELYEAWQKKRLDVSPGLVGLPQVSGRSDLTFEEVIKLDLYYIENWSLALDIKILAQAVPVVVRGRGAY